MFRVPLGLYSLGKAIYDIAKPNTHKKDKKMPPKRKAAMQAAKAIKRPRRAKAVRKSGSYRRATGSALTYAPRRSRKISRRSSRKAKKGFILRYSWPANPPSNIKVLQKIVDVDLNRITSSAGLWSPWAIQVMGDLEDYANLFQNLMSMENPSINSRSAVTAGSINQAQIINVAGYPTGASAYFDYKAPNFELKVVKRGFSTIVTNTSTVGCWVEHIVFTTKFYTFPNSVIASFNDPSAGQNFASIDNVISGNSSSLYPPTDFYVKDVRNPDFDFTASFYFQKQYVAHEHKRFWLKPGDSKTLSFELRPTTILQKKLLDVSQMTVNAQGVQYMPNLTVLHGIRILGGSTYGTFPAPATQSILPTYAPAQASVMHKAVHYAMLRNVNSKDQVLIQNFRGVVGGSLQQYPSILSTVPDPNNYGIIVDPQENDLGFVNHAIGAGLGTVENVTGT